VRHFCTYFDRRYLPRGLALHESLRRRAGAFALWVLCMDEETEQALTALAPPGVRPVGLGELEAADPELAAARGGRSRVEYYFTCTPAFLAHVLAREPAAETVTYLDADLFFFNDPAPLYAELGAGSVGIVEHRFPERLRWLEDRGRFNVEFVVFRRDAPGAACLAWWRERCIEWCHDRVEGDRFADQKYLDVFPERFENVVVLRHPGGGLAPWNVSRHAVTGKPGDVRVDGQPLVFYHFHGLRRESRRLYDPGLAPYGHRLTHMLRTALYRPYLTALLAAERRAAAWLGGEEGIGPGLRPPSETARRDLRYRAGRLKRAAGRLARRAWGLARADRLAVVGGRVY
jgi:hypothetical protein